MTRRCRGTGRTTRTTRSAPRCRTIDLGRWLGEKYRVARPDPGRRPLHPGRGGDDVRPANRPILRPILIDTSEGRGAARPSAVSGTLLVYAARGVDRSGVATRQSASQGAAVTFLIDGYNLMYAAGLARRSDARRRGSTAPARGSSTGSPTARGRRRASRRLRRPERHRPVARTARTAACVCGSPSARPPTT